MPAEPIRETAVDMLVRALSARIVGGTLGPGVRLDEQGLAEAFRVSRTPVREALAQLAAMGDQRQPSCPTPTAKLAAASSRRSGVARP